MWFRIEIYFVNSENHPFSQTDLQDARRRSVLPPCDWVNWRNTQKPFTYEHWEVNPFHLPMTPMLSGRLGTTKQSWKNLLLSPRNSFNEIFFDFLGASQDILVPTGCGKATICSPMRKLDELGKDKCQHSS